MERTHFQPEHDQFRESARRFFLAEVRPHAEEWYEDRIVDRSAFRKAGEQGLLLLWADTVYGGAGIEDYRFEQVIMEEQGRHGELGFFMSLHSRLVAPYIGKLGTEEQKRRLLPRCASGECILGIAMTEPGAGSDLAGIQTRAEDCGDHFLLNGSKTYVSNGINAACPGSSAGASFARSVLLMQFLAEERLINACGNLANAQASFDLTLDFVRQRRLFGRPLAAFQNTRFRMAEMRSQLDVAQVFIDHCVMLHNAGRLTTELAASAKLVTSETEGRVTDECVQLHGGAGYMEEYAIARRYTNARVSRIYAGTSEVMKEIIARGLGLDERRLA